MTPTRASLVVLGFALLAANRAQALDLPVRYPDREAMTAPSYRGDALLITLTPAASRQARIARPTAAGEGALPAGRALGVAAVDRLARVMRGARFQRVFPGESPPPTGSDEPDFGAFFRVLLPPGTILEDALERFRSLPDVAAAEPIAVLQGSAIPSDSLWAESWWFYQTPTGGIHAPEAWDITTGDTSIVVAIIDSGVLPDHPDIGGTVLGLRGQLWTNWAEAGGIPDYDDDGNGYVDDVAGWDFVDLTTDTGVKGGEDWSTADNDPSDFSGHGTRVAGLVGALTNNGIGASGTAWKVRLMPLRVMWSGSSQSSCGLTLVDMSYAAAAIRYATRMGATVVNCSFETTNEGDLFAAATAAIRAGITVVCSAGNGAQQHALQDRSDVLSVGSSDVYDHLSSFSSQGDYVDLVAPGETIVSTSVVHSDPLFGCIFMGSGYEEVGGTSFAAPLVSGTVALVQARQKALGLAPLGAQTMVFRMRETADDISSLNPDVIGYGMGRLNMVRALTDPPTSFARRIGGHVNGPAVVLPTLSGRARAAFTTLDRKVLLLDALTADTIAIAAIPANCARQIAAADMGGGYGLCFFAGLLNGKVAGFDAQLGPLPGWPVAGSGFLYRMDAGPALGDLDGDGVIEVVCGSDDGMVWAWHPDGTLVDGFPVPSGTQSWSGPVALGDLDGQPGVEIVAANRDGWVHVLRADASEMPGWPVAAAATAAPIVVALGHEAGPTVVVPAGNTVKGYSGSGVPRFSFPWSGTAGDPAAGDLDADGVDEIVESFSTPNAIVVLDSVGNLVLNRGWPRALPAPPAGPVLIGPLKPGPALGVYIYAGGTQIGLSDSAVALRQFPKPGGAGATPTFAELDGDGRTEVVAGTQDSVYYVYDAGQGTWSAGNNPWGTPRGNFARTGNRLYAPPIPALDDIPPQAAATFHADSITTSQLVLRWVAPGEDGAVGRAARYQIQMTTRRGNLGDFASGALFDPPPPDTAGTPQRFPLRGLAGGTRYYFALRTRDHSGNWSAVSSFVANTAPARLRPPRRDGGLPAIVTRVEPGRLPVALEWHAPEMPGVGARAIEVFDVSGRRLRRFELGAEEDGVLSWDGKDENGRRLPAGLYFARLTGGSLRAQARVVLLP